jgi:cellulose synthase/poly-beta-1,6-N-acetylglucosamine synthase-like glycosyltransferase
MLGELLEFTVSLLLLATAALVLLPRGMRRRPRADAAVSAVVLAADGGIVAWMSHDYPAALALTAIAAVACTVIWAAFRNWEILGCTLFVGVAGASTSYLAYVTLITFNGSLSFLGLAASVVLLALEAGAILLTITYAHELVDVLARRRWNHLAPSIAVPRLMPRVCIQVPTYNEPVELVKQTLKAIARLDYRNFMVQVVDNNTSDPALWEPIRAYCRKLGRRFDFIHLENWPGYKAGALNEAMRRLPVDVDIVVVVDADYVVEPSFLKETVGHFADGEVAFVQTPQHYRDWADNSYLSHCFYAFKYFYDVTMASRNERNAIIFCGTMGLIRRSVLDAIGGWDEWCIIEDAEASLRILALGYRGVFVNKAYGHGLMPLSFEGLKKQRFRWAFGGMQVLKKHWRLMLTGKNADGSPSRLTRAQQYHYLMGSLQWFNELLTVGFTGLLLVSGAVLLLGNHLPMRQLTGAVLAIPILFILSGLLRLVWALRVRSGASFRQALGAVGVLFSLSWVVAQACVLGLVRPQGVFLRTPKARSNSSVIKAATSTRTEGMLVVAAVMVGAGILLLRPGSLATFIAGLVMMQGFIYANAPVNAVRAEGIRLTPMRRIFRDSPQNTGQRPALANREVRKAVLATALALVGTFFLAVLATAPEGAGLQAPSDLLPKIGGIAAQPLQPQGPSSGSPSPEPSTGGSRSTPSVQVTTGNASPPAGTTSTTSPAPSPRPGVTPSRAASSHPAPKSAPTGRPTSTPSPHH